MLQRPSVLYKIAPRADFEAAREMVPWSDHDRRDGFVHLSAPRQLRATAERHFSSSQDLVLLAIDPTNLRGLVWEPSRGGELFPHVYADIPRQAVVQVYDLVADAAGGFVFPPDCVDD